MDRPISDQPSPAGPSRAPLTAFVSFPSPYTQSLIIQALVSCLSSISITLLPPNDSDPPQLQWADYDLLSFDKPHSSPSTHLMSSYIYRKALIRKHQLHLTITEYLAKCQHRGVTSCLAEGGVPKGWVVDIQFADELDELLLDDLYDLAEGMRENDERDEHEKRWYILKPGFADRAQGIRLFSSEEELRDIFLSFEPPSDDEENDDEDEEVDGKEEDNDDGSRENQSLTQYGKGPEDEHRLRDQLASVKLDPRDLHLGEGNNDEGGEYGERDGTAIMTSQLRHFVIQEYMPRPLLFDVGEESDVTIPTEHMQGHKFHLRAYVLLTGAYTLHLSQTLLALFSSEPYTHPSSSAVTDQLGLRPHLTNTCLQMDELGVMRPEEDLVKLFWELEGLTALHHGKEGYEAVGKVNRRWLDETFARVGEVVADAVKAGVECGSFGLQLMPNAFEIFGVDLILSYPSSPTAGGALPLPTVTLLEFNASPDFVQSGDRLKPHLAEMFKGTVKIAVAPFFGLEVRGDPSDRENEGSVDHRGQNEGQEGKVDGGAAEWVVGEDRYGWRRIGKGQVRGPTV